MRSRSIFLILFISCAFLPSWAVALPMGAPHFEIRTSLAGDIDAIDGLASNLPPGGEIDIVELFKNPRDEGIFDTDAAGANQPIVAWTQDGFQDFDVFAAFAVIGSAGWGHTTDPPVLQIEGQEVGSFRESNIENQYTLNFFDLTPFVSFLEQPDFQFSFIRPEYTGDNGDLFYDFGALDFSKVFAAGHYNPGYPIPEPATVILLGAGLLGAVGLRRKSNQK